MNNGLNIMQYLVFGLYVLALIAQGAAVLICISGFRYLKRFRMSWAVLSLGLLLMLGRRFGAIWIFHEPPVPGFALFDSGASFVISLLLFFGLFTVRRALIELNNKNKELDALNRLDSLTHAISRSEIMRLGVLEIERSLRTRMPMAVIELDIDHFKHINDQSGHQVGDEILNSLTQSCQAMLRANDFFGRVGGEEFVILLPDTTQSRAMDAAERIRASVAAIEHITSAAQPIRITISLGVSIFEPAQIQSFNQESLFKQQLERADQAMYRAKHAGRNCVSIWDDCAAIDEATSKGTA